MLATSSLTEASPKWWIVAKSRQSLELFKTLSVKWRFLLFSVAGKISTRRFWLLSSSLLWKSADASYWWAESLFLSIKSGFSESFCNDSHPAGAGLSDIPGEAMVKLYCPKCMDVYTPKSSRHHHTDGAYFGTGFPHMLFMVHPEYRPKRPANQFVPRWVSGEKFWH